MNRSERAEIKKLILSQIDLFIEKQLIEKQLIEKQLIEKRLTKNQPDPGQAAGDALRLQRLETALKRIDADNFGECFKCEKPIAMSRLRNNPESVICTACLD